MASLRKELAALLTAQRVAVLATQNEGQPFCQSDMENLKDELWSHRSWF